MALFERVKVEINRDYKILKIIFKILILLREYNTFVPNDGEFKCT